MARPTVHRTGSRRLMADKTGFDPRHRVSSVIFESFLAPYSPPELWACVLHVVLPKTILFYDICRQNKLSTKVWKQQCRCCGHGDLELCKCQLLVLSPTPTSLFFGELCEGCSYVRKTPHESTIKVTKPQKTPHISGCLRCRPFQNCPNLAL